MKLFSMFVGSLVLAASTFATTAQAMSMPEPYTVLTIRASAGLVPEGRVMQELSLRNDGSVHVKELFRERDNSAEGYTTVTKEHESLWSETPETMQKIFAALQIVKGGELRDEQPDRPAYSDGEYLSYEITTGRKPVQFAKSVGGKTYIVKDPAQAKAARYLRLDLNELRKAINNDQQN